MDPLDALTDSNPKAPADDTAPAAAAWLHNPDAPRAPQKLTKWQEIKLWLREVEKDLAENGQWDGPPYGSPENPHDDHDPHDDDDDQD